MKPVLLFFFLLLCTVMCLSVSSCPYAVMRAVYSVCACTALGCLPVLGLMRLVFRPVRGLDSGCGAVPEVRLRNKHFRLAGTQSGLLSALVFCMLAALVIRNSVYSLPFVSIKADTVVCITGRAVYDSSFSGAGNHFMSVALASAEIINGSVVSARGLVAVVSGESALIPCGTLVQMKGRFTEDSLFICKELSVLEKGYTAHLREFIISAVERRLLGEGYYGTADNASLLSLMLILGRAEDRYCPVMELAAMCGCLHVLALSGMHLNILAGIIRHLTGNRKYGKPLVWTVAAAFVFTAGPRPSLMRAFLMFVSGEIPALKKLSPEQRLAAVLLAHILLFPQSFASIGCVYGYLAVTGLAVFGKYINGCLFFIPSGKLRETAGSCIAVLLFCAPLEIMLNGCWYPSALPAGPAAGVLAAASMLLGLLVLLFGRMPLLTALNGTVYSLMESLFTGCSRLPAAGPAGYMLLLSVPAVLYPAAAALRHVKRRRLERELKRLDIYGKIELVKANALRDEPASQNMPEEP